MPSIAIVGAGPAGLTLARLLLVNAKIRDITDLKLTIFESDASSKARWKQGGCLDLHPDTGIAALKAAHMWDDILPHMRYEGEELFFADRNATTVLHITSASDLPGAGAAERPEVDREVLKDYLLQAVEDIAGKEAVTWGKRVASADAQTGILKFKDGTEAGPFDLVVGADGAWSKIRQVVTDVKPTYSGICGFQAIVDKEHAGGKWEEYIKFVGKGSYYAYTGGKSIMGQRQGDGSIRIGMWLTKSADWSTDVWEQTGGEDEKLREALLKEFADWDDQFLRLVRCGWHWRQWPLYELPVGHSWEHKKGWTLIGDSAHLMTPFAGEGVNAAMRDCLELAKNIEAALLGRLSLDEAVEKSEKDMFPRNEKVQQQTMRNKTGMFREDAPVGFLANGMEMMAAESGYDTTKGWISWVLPPVSKVLYSYLWSVVTLGHFRRLMRRT